MPKLRIASFDGERSRESDTTLPENWAQQADNVRLYAGELRAYRGSQFTFSPVTVGSQTIYNFVNPLTNNNLWLTWDTRVNVARGSLADNTDFRLYYTGDGAPKKTNWALAGDATLSGEYPGEFMDMGVPAPTTAPTVAATTGTSTATDTRFYVYTFVNTFGSLEEESAPSPVSASVTITTSQSVNITGLETAPVGDHNITAIRIYRTVPGEATLGAYLFVKEISIGTTSTNDDLGADDLGESITTIGWAEPPDDLQGIISMANGMMAGFVGNSVYFCEPYFHHAWPAEYIQSIPDQIVGLGSYGNTLVVLTENSPWLMIGVDPAQMSVERLTLPEPCISAPSIASDEYGVVYASPNGLVSIGNGGRGVITHALFRRKDWQEYSPDTFVGAIFDGNYFGSFQSADFGNRTMVLSREDKPALSFLSIRADAFYTDVGEGELYYLDNVTDDIYKVDADSLRPFTYEWVSKRFFYGQGFSWSCVQIDVDKVQLADNTDYLALLAEIEAANELLVPAGGSLNGAGLNVYLLNGNNLATLPLPSALLQTTFFLLGEEGEELAVLNVDDFRPYRLPPSRSRVYQIKMTGNLNIRSVTLATSVQELRS